MSALVFLLVAVVVSARRLRLCSGASTAQPTTLESGIDAFRREMDALGPAGRRPTPDRRDGTR